MNKFLPLLLILGSVLASQAFGQARGPAATPPQASPTPAPASPLDGEWRGTSDGGSCNAPLEYMLTIEAGFVDGTAYDATARGPVPNTTRAPPPAPTPSLWQIHGVARSTGPFSLIAVASVKGTTHREGKLAARNEGGGLVVTETSGCRRTARLAKG
jgi:hypothetical protein